MWTRIGGVCKVYWCMVLWYAMVEVGDGGAVLTYMSGPGLRTAPVDKSGVALRVVLLLGSSTVSYVWQFGYK